MADLRILLHGRTFTPYSMVSVTDKTDNRDMWMDNDRPFEIGDELLCYFFIENLEMGATKMVAAAFYVDSEHHASSLNHMGSKALGALFDCIMLELDKAHYEALETAVRWGQASVSRLSVPRKAQPRHSAHAR